MAAPWARPNLLWSMMVGAMLIAHSMLDKDHAAKAINSALGRALKSVGE